MVESLKWGFNQKTPPFYAWDLRKFLTPFFMEMAEGCWNNFHNMEITHKVLIIYFALKRYNY